MPQTNENNRLYMKLYFSVGGVTPSTVSATTSVSGQRKEGPECGNPNTCPILYDNHYEKDGNLEPRAIPLISIQDNPTKGTNLFNFSIIYYPHRNS